ncbi:MAG TPA: hypothetical protein VMX97_17425, partial [Hyphomicrobiaceae bacterium]|nr:hypothetical protein [Hyphomicrobiaceae bacterium]
TGAHSSSIRRLLCRPPTRPMAVRRAATMYAGTEGIIRVQILLINVDVRAQRVGRSHFSICSSAFKNHMMLAEKGMDAP